MAASIVDIILRAKNQASKELTQVTNQLRGMDKAAKFALGGLTSLGGGFAVMQAGKFAVEMAQLNTQLERSAFAFENFSGGADQAAANLRAVQRASGGMLSQFDAQNIAVTAMTQGLANTSGELERITKIARGIVAVSPIIKDLESAFSQLGLTIANQAWLRLDQLGTSAGELKPKIEALKNANSDLSDEMAFEIALLDTLETKFAPLTDAAVNSASGLERLNTALRDNRAAIAGNFAWFDSLAGRMANMVTMAGSTSRAMELIQNPPANATAEQLAIIAAMQKQIDLVQQREIAQYDAEKNIQAMLDAYYRLRDAAVQAGQAEAAAAKAASDENARALQELSAMRASYDAQIEQAGQRAFQAVYAETGSLTLASAAYEQAINKIKAAMSDLPDNFSTPAQKLMILPAVIARVGEAIEETFSFGTEATGDFDEAAAKLGTTMDLLGGFVTSAAGQLLVFARNSVAAQSAAVNIVGAIDAAFSAMGDVADRRDGASFGNLSGKIRDPLALEDGMKAIGTEAAHAKVAVAGVNSEFENLKSTISGIVTGAIGPVAGVDANDLLPRPDAVNENARRLADIAVNGFKGQDWLQQFQNEVPDIYQALVESGDPKMAAATMLKDFQDGLLSGTGVLIDKERAKDLVRRALLGQSNTQALINEIAQELAAETGTAFSAVQAQAQSLLGGGGMSQNGETGAAFARGMVTGVADSTVGADVTGVVYGQIMASIGVIERSGRDAGSGWASGFMSGAADLPTNIIAMIVRLVTPGVIAGMNQQGSRTGAAGT